LYKLSQIFKVLSKISVDKKLLTVALHVPVEVLLVAEEKVEEAVPEVGVEDGVDDGVQHRVRVRHELDPELVGAQPVGQLKQVTCWSSASGATETGYLLELSQWGN
jgi:hypothetical protein